MNMEGIRMKYAIAKTYGIQSFKGSLSYVSNVKGNNSYFTTIPCKALLFDSIEELIKFAEKKKVEVRNFYSRSNLYIQVVDEELISNEYSLKDSGKDNLLVKWKQFQVNGIWSSDTKEFINGF
jgi:hypothetical protein